MKKTNFIKTPGMYKDYDYYLRLVINETIKDRLYDYLNATSYMVKTYFPSVSLRFINYFLGGFVIKLKKKPVKFLNICDEINECVEYIRNLK